MYHCLCFSDGKLFDISDTLRAQNIQLNLQIEKFRDEQAKFGLRSGDGVSAG